MNALLRRRTMIASGGGSPTPPTPYTPVEYIETDGAAYIDTGVYGNDARSCELKYSTSSIIGQCVLGVGNGSEDTTLYYMVYISGSGYPGFGHRYFYTNASAPVSVGDPFEARCAMKLRAQSLKVKRTGDASFITLSKTQGSTITTNKTMYLFAAHKTTEDVPHQLCPTGSRLYYCKIYTDNTYSTLVFDGVPCYYEGEYGLWDKVSDSFFGAVSGSGTFTGPIIS